MSLLITYSTGQNCSLPEGGCVVVLNPNTETTLVSTDRYLLLSGTANVTYGNDAPVTISSPYSGSEWQSYVDSWNYGLETKIAVNPTTQFLQVFANNSILSNLQITKIDNSNIDVSVKPNSSVIVIGSNFFIDNEAHANKPCTFFKYTEEKTINIRTLDICRVIYLEEA